MVAQHIAANVSAVKNQIEWFGLSVQWADDTRDVCEIDVSELLLFLDREVLNIDVPRMFSRSIRVYHVHALLSQ
jgi:hypothetical protein